MPAQESPGGRRQNSTAPTWWLIVLLAICCAAPVLVLLAGGAGLTGAGVMRSSTWLPIAGIIVIAIALAWWVNRIFFGTVSSNVDHFERAIALMPRLEQKFPGSLAGMLTGRYPVEQYEAAFESPVIKNVLVFLSRS